MSVETDKQSVYEEVDLHPETNNTEHHTNEISVKQLIVRRGQPFKLTLKLAQPFTPNLYPLTFKAFTGSNAAENLGTLSCFGLPDTAAQRSPSAKAVWKVELETSSILSGNMNLTITPPADAPVGNYTMHVTHGDKEIFLAKLAVLFNPWCADDWVFLPDEKERQEYVMNDQGIIYRGSGNYIHPMNWDFGQFEENMVDICMRILDRNHKHLDDPADDVSARCNPIYVSRVVSAMINSEDDRGVVQGRWGGPYWGGKKPSHWTGSHAILKKWLVTEHPVKYGQCWVFAGVMCSVMRLLGIPCRVITNFESAHDNNKNLTIDVFHGDYGVRVKPSRDSIWNFHVWVEGWMRRPDLVEDGKYDGWQVVDPTPQEKSDNVYCCGPAPVKAILNGETALKYDIPFVFAEVNADCVDWLVKADDSRLKMWSDTKRVGQNISTKAVGSRKRVNITDTYKHREGSEKERSVFKYACTRDYSRTDEDEKSDEEAEDGEMEEEVENEEMVEEVDDVEAGEEDEDGEVEEEDEAGGTETTDNIPPPPVSIRFKELSKPTNGKDVKLKLVLHSESSVERQLSINISVQAMMYNGSPAGNIQTEVKTETLRPGTDLKIPITVPFSAYYKSMMECDTMKVLAVVTDQQSPNEAYLAQDDVVLLDPPISVSVRGKVRVNRFTTGELVFMNPVKETLENCTLTLSGSGLFKEEVQYRIRNLEPGRRLRVKFPLVPYKVGKKTLVADFDCSIFRDIKCSCTVKVK